MAETVMQTLDRRARDHSEWLEKNAPEVFDEQDHLNEGSSERAYWHFGYLAAIRDIRDWLAGNSDRRPNEEVAPSHNAGEGNG